MPAAVSVPIHLGQTARGLLRRLTPGAAAMGKRRDARRAAAHRLIQAGAAQAEAADSVPDGMPPDEASAQLGFISPASMWGTEAPQAARRRPAKAGTLLSQKPAFYAAQRLAKAGMILSQNPALYAAQRPAKAGTIRSQKPAFYAAQRLARAGMILPQNPAFYAAQRPA